MSNINWSNVAVGVAKMLFQGYQGYKAAKREEERKREASRIHWGDLASRAASDLYEKGKIYSEFQRDMRNVFKD